MNVITEFRKLRDRLKVLETQVTRLPSRMNAGGGGTGDSTAIWYTATTKAGLPETTAITIVAMGRVEGVDSDNGMVCIRNPANNGWDALNFCE